MQQQGKRLQVASARIGCTCLHLPRANRLHSAMPTCMCGLQRVDTQHNCKPVSGVNKRQRAFIWSNSGKAYWVSKARIPVDTSPRSVSQSSAILMTGAIRDKGPGGCALIPTSGRAGGDPRRNTTYLHTFLRTPIATFATNARYNTNSVARKPTVNQTICRNLPSSQTVSPRITRSLMKNKRREKGIR